MAQEKNTKANPLYSLIPLEDFKVVLSIDDREEKIARFCLVTSTFSIEQFCKRRFLRKKHFEWIDFNGDLILPLREYPVSKVSVVYALYTISTCEILEHEFYQIIPDCGCNEDIPFLLSLSPAIKKRHGLNAIKVIYKAGYVKGKAPPDLASACLELAAWNMNRYRGRRIGMTGNVRGGGKDGEHFELSMPENVQRLLEPYRRKTI